MRILVLGFVVGVLTMATVACGNGDPTSVPAQEVISTSTPAPISANHQVFITNGCAACHGQDAEGTEIAPPLAGHTASQVKRQVRAPLGTMPLYPPDKISNAELMAITEYIEGLQGEHTHIQATDSPDELALHHWMALFSMEAENPAEGIHHLGHIIELTAGEHRAQMEMAMDLLKDEEIHEAAHIVEEMLAGIEAADSDVATLQLTLALSSARAEEIQVSIHHIEHYLELPSDNPSDTPSHILTLLQQGEVHDAVNELENLLGEAQLEEEHEEEHEEDDGHDEPHDEPATSGS